MTRARLIIAAAVLIVLAGLVWLIRHDGQKAGEARVTTKVERQRTERVAEARRDERAASVVTESISRRVNRADALSTVAVQTTIKDLRDAIDAVPPAVAGTPPPAAPVDGLRDALNASIARANRAAEPSPAAR